jgi:hypothetical protein
MNDTVVGKWIAPTLRSISAVVASILIPILTGVLITKPTGVPLLSGFEQFTLGVLTFLVIEVVGISWNIHKLVRIERLTRDVIEAREPIERTLENIRASYMKILERQGLEDNLFALYFARLFSGLDDKIYEAATKQELKVDEPVVAAKDLLFGICERGGIDLLRLVHPLDAEPTNLTFKIWRMQYYRDITRLAASGRVSVRRLFICSDDSQLENPTFSRLFDFHARNPGYDYRIINKADWDALVAAHDLPSSEEDFGVWGSAYTWVQTKYSQYALAGVYSSQRRNIEIYTDMFDAAWNLAKVPAPRPGEFVTVYELFEGAPPPPHLISKENAAFGNQKRDGSGASRQNIPDKAARLRRSGPAKRA